MYIWKLALINVVTPHHDTLRSCVVVAETQAEARVLASSKAGDEGREVWNSPDRSSCLQIGQANAQVIEYPGVICADFLEG